MKSFKDIVEINSQTAVFAFGRFNPPTAGHLKLAMKVKQVAGSDDGFIYTSPVSYTHLTLTTTPYV